MTGNLMKLPSLLSMESLNLIESLCVWLAPFVNARNADAAILAGQVLFLLAVALLVAALILLRRRRTR